MADKNQAVSARKFRPQTFSQIIGQPHIVRTITNAINKGRIAHAYLFSGTRGVGKTTTARVLAKALNCEKGPTSTPCLECVNCREITDGVSMDVMEIDGASNTGVDNIRDLKENVMFTPTKSTYKIYIIDEVHQISRAAFNALLKTLEEPPAHVVFIFATTELGKVPDTILSRCQCFEYKTISLNDIAAQLEMIAQHEGVNATPEAIHIIARRAKGSMRDAQSMFDQAAAYGGGAISGDDVKLILGLVDSSTMFSVVDAVVAGDKAELFDLAGSIANSGSDPVMFLEDLASTVRNIMVAKIRSQSLDGYNENEMKWLVKQARLLDYDDIQRFFSVITGTINQIRFSSQPMLIMEMGLLRLTEKRGLASIATIIEEVSEIQTNLERVVGSASPQPGRSERITATAPPHSAGDEPLPDCGVGDVDSNVEPAPPSIQASVSGGRTSGLLDTFKTAGPVIMGIMERATLQIKADAVIVIVGDIMSRDHLGEAETRKKLEDLAEKHFGRRMRLVVEFHDEKKNADDKQEHRSGQLEASIRRQVMDTPVIQSAMDIFQGEIIDFKITKHL